MDKIKSFFISYDFGISFVLGIALYIFMPEYIQMTFTADYYGVVITAISIIFSLVFASCSILLSSSDNDFINFLNEENDFDNLLWTFRITLISLFICLLYSLVLFVGTSYYLKHSAENEIWLQHKSLFITLTSITVYSLIATYLSVEDTLIFSKFRSRFLKKQEDEKNRLNDSTKK